jgi:N-acetyl-gamma-glutamyl-phosphate reductase
MNTKLKVGVIGGAGYTGGELIRLLLNHEEADIAFVHSRSQAGKELYAMHHDLLGETSLKFTDTHNETADVLILCVGHGEARKFLEKMKTSPDTKIIDLSQDHRLQVKDGQQWVYGLPELNRNRIAGANRVANPGCFATAIQLALLPLASQRMLCDDVHISATTGSTGAGQALTPTSHFSWRAGNLGVYKAFEHQHLEEIGESLRFLQPGFQKTLHFLPHRGGYTRGILAGVYTNNGLKLEEAQMLYTTYYRDHPFVRVSTTAVDLKQVINTNKCFLHLEKHGERLLITSVIDNLLKGASGQAVQNMNLMFGFPETLGLKLKASVF